MDEREKCLELINSNATDEIEKLKDYYDNVDITKLTLSELKEYLINVMNHC